MKRHDILGVGFSLLSYTEVMDAIQGWRGSRERHYVTLTPPHSVMMCQRDPQLRQATNGASLTLPDGVGIIVAAKLLRYPHHGRVTGPMLMLKLCEAGRDRGLRHFFYGGYPGVARTLAARFQDRFPGLMVAGVYCPPFRELETQEELAIVRDMNGCQPDIVWVGLGSPKQEKWMAQQAGRIQAAALIGVGAAFDFHSGRIPWAPRWMRQMGVEWAYRLVKEPRRMWRRDFNSLVFLARVLHQCLRDAGHTQVTLTSEHAANPLSQRDADLISGGQALSSGPGGLLDVFVAGSEGRQGARVSEAPCPTPVWPGVDAIASERTVKGTPSIIPAVPVPGEAKSADESSRLSTPWIADRPECLGVERLDSS
jgi:N-acetylglucosaminyldiphosphoundecaprenol N-acetyl-beta-D-mannosaminyltransferase